MSRQSKEARRAYRLRVRLRRGRKISKEEARFLKRYQEAVEKRGGRGHAPVVGHLSEGVPSFATKEAPPSTSAAPSPLFTTVTDAGLKEDYPLRSTTSERPEGEVDDLAGDPPPVPDSIAPPEAPPVVPDGPQGIDRPQVQMVAGMVCGWMWAQQDAIEKEKLASLNILPKEAREWVNQCVLLSVDKYMPAGVSAIRPEFVALGALGFTVVQGYRASAIEDERKAKEKKPPVNQSVSQAPPVDRDPPLEAEGPVMDIDPMPPVEVPQILVGGA